LNLEDDAKAGASEISSSSSSMLITLLPYCPPSPDRSDSVNIVAVDAGLAGNPGPAVDLGRAGVPLTVRGGNCLDDFGWRFLVDG
jgi:hypothetical protein